MNDILFQLYAAGLGYRKAGSQAGISRRAAQRILTRAGIMRDPPPMPPTPPPHDDVLRIELKKAKKMIVSRYRRPMYLVPTGRAG